MQSGGQKGDREKDGWRESAEGSCSLSSIVSFTHRSSHQGLDRRSHSDTRQISHHALFLVSKVTLIQPVTEKQN